MTAMRLIITIAALLLLALPAGAQCRQPANAEALMREAARLVNAARKAQGRAALARDPRLDAAAQAHACDMAARADFSHRGANGSTPKVRVKARGYCTRLTAENIAQGQKSGQEVAQAWLDSAGHRKNILVRSLREYGLGVAIWNDGRPVWVMDFARPCR